MSQTNQPNQGQRDQPRIAETQAPESPSNQEPRSNTLIIDHTLEVSETGTPATIALSNHYIEMEVPALSEHTATVQTPAGEGDHRDRRGPTDSRTKRQQQSVTPEPSPGRKPTPMLELPKVEHAGKSSSRKAGGPRTAAGKNRSKYNAVTHGFYTKKLLLRNESPAEFEKLRDGLWHALKPKGTLSGELFEAIVWQFWNNRRFLRAHNALIAAEMEALEFNRITAQMALSWDSERLGSIGGMLKPGCNAFELRKAIQYLELIRCSVQTNCINVEQHSSLLERLYGNNADGTPAFGVFRSYVFFIKKGCALAFEQGEKTVMLTEELTENMLEMLDAEINSLTARLATVLKIERRAVKNRLEQALVPSQAALDRQIRHETHSTRELARLLMLFELAQRTSQE